MTNILSAAQIFTIARIAGFQPAEAVIATAITQPEAGANADAIQQDVPYYLQGWGLWQITPGNSVPSVAVDYGLLVPQANADAAYVKFVGRHRTFLPWTTYTSGKYLKWMGWAQAGAQAAGAGNIVVPSGPGAGLGAGPGGSPDPQSLIPGTINAWQQLMLLYNGDVPYYQGTYSRLGPY